MPGNPWFWPWANSLAISSLFGDLKYSFEKIATTAATNFFKLVIAVVYAILTYSSIKSTATP